MAKNIMEIRFVVSETNKEKLMKILSKAKAKIILCNAIDDDKDGFDFRIVTVMTERKFWKYRRKLWNIAEVALFNN